MTTPLPASSPTSSADRIERAYGHARDALLARRGAHGHWEGTLSTSALSTATAVMALEMVPRARALNSAADLNRLISRGVAWIAAHQNPDGGWGDTTISVSNISTTMLCRAVFHALAAETVEGRTVAESYATVIAAAQAYIDRAGGVPALIARYGKDKTFSIPILTHCALAGQVDWHDIAPLPFELACVPANFYKWIGLPVVSYALPALIAIGQARHHFVKPWNPLTRLVRNAAIGPSLKILERIQPTSGGFLEATPLTAFVTMSLAGIGLTDHAVTRLGVDFLIRSVRDDGSWPIDTNLATWVTTLSVQALGPDLPADAKPPIENWLLGQQYREVHPYTNAPPGGWAWTDLPGGVPDADDTPGAILALLNLHRNPDELSTSSDESPDHTSPTRKRGTTPHATSQAHDLRGTFARGLVWLINLQNRDGGWPTFCRGWGTLPFDRSAPDLTAHVLRAFAAWMRFYELPLEGSLRHPNVQDGSYGKCVTFLVDVRRRRDAGFKYLARSQRADGSWLPLWFGNQFVNDDENPTYGTARVLAAYRDCDRLTDAAAVRGIAWLKNAQNPDGGWGGAPGTPSTVEETALAVEILLSCEPPPMPRAPQSSASSQRPNGLDWLVTAVEDGKWLQPSPIGFYFAKLWYFEELYPLIFTVAALGRAVRQMHRST